MQVGLANVSKALDALVARMDYDSLVDRIVAIDELATEIDSEQTWDLVYQVRCLLDAVETYIERHHAA